MFCVFLIAWNDSIKTYGTKLPNGNSNILSNEKFHKTIDTHANMSCGVRIEDKEKSIVMFLGRTFCLAVMNLGRTIS